MYWLADVLVIAFILVMLIRGIKKGFLNTTFTLVTAIKWIALAGGLTFVTIWFVLQPLGWIRELQFYMLKVIGETNALFELIGMESEDIALYLAYGVCGLTLFIPFYVLSLWIGKLFEKLVDFIRSKCSFLRVLGSIVGGLVNFAIASVIVIGLFWVVSAVDGSGVFDFTNEVLKSAPLSSLLYNNNPLEMIGLGGHGCYAEIVKSIVSGDFSNL